jgi:trehalose 6-phosphate phosphatase
MQAIATGVGAPALFPDLREWAILLDVDGTIVDLAPTPADIHVPPSLRETLIRLREKSSGAVALVSGRTLRDLDQIFAPLRLAVIGGHGAELRLMTDSEPRRSDVVPLDPVLKQALTTIAESKYGILFEDKGYSAALHYRLVPEHEAYVRESVSALCARFPEHSLEVLDGTFVVEVKHRGFSKGTAVRALMTCAPFKGRRPIFIGDDTTDLAAFAVVPQFNGLAISVRRHAPGVDFHFDTPEQVRNWLSDLATADEGAPA